MKHPSRVRARKPLKAGLPAVRIQSAAGGSAAANSCANAAPADKPAVEDAADVAASLRLLPLLKLRRRKRQEA